MIKRKKGILSPRKKHPKSILNLCDVVIIPQIFQIVNSASEKTYSFNQIIRLFACNIGFFTGRRLAPDEIRKVNRSDLRHRRSKKTKKKTPRRLLRGDNYLIMAGALLISSTKLSK